MKQMKKKTTTPMNTFGGMITQIVTQTNDSRFYIGQSFSGYYQYDSIDPDGVFHVANNLPPAGNRSLCGIVYLPFPEGRARLNALPVTMNDGSLTVSGGLVTAFAWSLESGGYWASFTNNTFFARLSGRVDPSNGQPLPNIETRGTVSFSAPLRQS
jgi:hypothetical protein